MNEVRNNSINLAFRECSNHCEEVKWKQSLIQEEFKKLQCQWEKQAKAVGFIGDGDPPSLQPPSDFDAISNTPHHQPRAQQLPPLHNPAQLCLSTSHIVYSLSLATSHLAQS